MNRANLIPLAAAIFLGSLTLGAVAGAAPSVLQLTGLLCDSGTSFRTVEGTAHRLPDQRNVAPVSFSCEGPAGSSEPHFARAAVVAWLVVTAAWFAAARLAVRRLVGK